MKLIGPSRAAKEKKIYIYIHTYIHIDRTDFHCRRHSETYRKRWRQAFN